MPPGLAAARPSCQPASATTRLAAAALDRGAGPSPKANTPGLKRAAPSLATIRYQHLAAATGWDPDDCPALPVGLPLMAKAILYG
jgi:hypothetical protein